MYHSGGRRQEDRKRPVLLRGRTEWQLACMGRYLEWQPKGQRHGRCPLGLTLLAIPKRERNGRQRLWRCLPVYHTTGFRFTSHISASFSSNKVSSASTPYSCAYCSSLSEIGIGISHATVFSPSSRLFNSSHINGVSNIICFIVRLSLYIEIMLGYMIPGLQAKWSSIMWNAQLLTIFPNQSYSVAQAPINSARNALSLSSFNPML